LICLAALPAAAQDSHYWANQYGVQANLLGGLVIGSVTGLSATFYNPGSLPLMDQGQVILASRVFEFANTSLTNLVGAPDISSTYLGPVPTMLAGALKRGGYGRHWLGYCYLTRRSVNLDISGTGTSPMDLTPSVPGLENVAVNLTLSERLTESWFGLSWAYKVSPSLGVGVSQYFTVRAHHLDLETGTSVSLPDGNVALATESSTYYYFNWRVLWKAGVVWDSRRLTLGATLTTPSLYLYGQGHSGVNNTAVGPQPDVSSPPDYVEADYQSGLKADSRSPLSLGAGATLKLNGLRLYASTEWFSSLKAYTVMNGRDFIGQTSGLIIPNKVTSELQSVVNYGVGLEYAFRPSFKLSTSYRVDHTARPQKTDTNLSPADWDISWFTGGAEFKIGRSEFALGLAFGSGSRRNEGQAETFAAVPRLAVPGLGQTREFTYRSFRIILGFSI
jgi:hypothetical protein